MKKIYFLSLILCFSTFVFAQGSITNVNATQRTDGSGLVDIYFDLSGSGTSYFMNMKVSFDAGAIYYYIVRSTITGDLGPISPGTNKHIIWNPTVEYPNRFSPETKVMLIAYKIESSNPCPGNPTVTDYDGNTYNTILVGSQCWMLTNLNVSHNPIGNTITSYCYNNDLNYCDDYGRLYDWATVMNGASSSSANPSGVQGICPNGWHVPSDAEWTALTDSLINGYPDITSSNVGNKLKSCRQVSSPLGGDCSTSTHPRWDANSTHHGTNDFGYSALPGGNRNSNGSFSSLGSLGYWWSSTQSSSANVWLRYMSYDSGSAYRYPNNKSNGFAVRCIKD